MFRRDSSGPRWPDRLRELCHELRVAPGEAEWQAARASLWVLMHTALLRWLGHHARRSVRIAREDLEDIAAKKSLELLGSIESGGWDPSGRDGAEISAFLSTIARNGLIDLGRRGARLVRAPVTEAGAERWEHLVQGSDGSVPRGEPPPDSRVESREFARGLCECADSLQARERLVWFLRVFHEMSSKEIARHPDIHLEPSHVDVLLQRCRAWMRDCMSSKGFQPSDMPPGTFVALLRAFRLDGMRSGAEVRK